jgi:hypothetical protein
MSVTFRFHPQKAVEAAAMFLVVSSGIYEQL